MARLVRRFDWGGTPLGSIESWSPALRCAVQIMLDSPQAASLVVGSERILLFNDETAALCDGAHRNALGRPVGEFFGSRYEGLADRLDRAFAGQSLPSKPRSPGAASGCEADMLNGSLTPVRTQEGDVMAVLLSRHVQRIAEGGKQARAPDPPQPSEERLRQFGEASHDMLCIRDARTLRWNYVNPAFETIFGMGRSEALEWQSIEGWLNLILPEDRERAEANIEKVKGGEHATYGYRIVRPADGAVRWLRTTDFPIADGQGNVVLIGGITHDATASLETERRLKTLVEGMPQLVWRSSNGGDWTWASPQWEEYTGQGFEEHEGQGWLDAVHPEDRDAARKAWRKAPEDGGFEVEYRILHAASGRYNWFKTRAAPVRDNAGDIVEWLGTSTDIDEMHRMQQLQRSLLGELQHRVRNILGMVRALVRGSTEDREGIDDFVAHLVGRLDAMARTQVMLTRGAGTGIDLEGLLRDELQAYATGAKNWSIEGPAVSLPAKAAESLSLAVHELTTNSVKYGTLSGSGFLSVSWRTYAAEGTDWLEFFWKETGLVGPVGEVRQGFGTELIERRVPYELEGEASLEITPEGARARIAFPLKDLGSVLETSLQARGG
jgi:PAS domain S-box-containing protein